MKKYLITALTACVASTTANQLISTTVTNNDVENNIKINNNIYNKNNINNYKLEIDNEFTNENKLIDNFSDVGHQASTTEINSVDMKKIDNWGWFSKLKTKAAIGYIDLKNQGARGTGLCEYISLSLILTYYELFVSKGFFSDQEWNKYFTYESNNLIKVPKHNYQKEKNLSYNLYKLINRVDLWWASDVSYTLRQFLKDKEINNKVSDDYCASVMHSSSPEKYFLSHNIPVMMSSAGYAHNWVIYGYNSKNNTYLVNYGHPNKNTWIINKSDVWSFWKAGFLNAFWLNPSEVKNPRKAFLYNGNNYSWQELEKLGIKWNDINEF